MVSQTTKQTVTTTTNTVMQLGFHALSTTPLTLICEIPRAITQAQADQRLELTNEELSRRNWINGVETNH